MKTKILILGFLLIILNGCSEKDMEYGNINFNSETFIVFSNAEMSVNELVLQPIEIKVLYAASSSSAKSLSIPFTISSTNAVEGVDYMIVDNKTSFNFTSTDLSDSVFIMPIDETNPSGNKQLTISLNSNEVSLGYPGPDGNNASMVLTIIDNDCPYTLEELGNASWSGSDNASGSQGPNASQIETSFDGNTFFFEGIAYGWLTGAYWDEVVITSNLVAADFNTLTGDINIDLQPLCTTTWNGAVQPDYSIEATGSYDSCSETITLNYNLYQNGDILISYTEIITK